MLRLLVIVSLVGLGIGGVVESPERIVGGHLTTIYKYPYMVSLHHSNKHICGASILSETRVLTSASCVQDKYPHDLSVRAGSTYKNREGHVVKVLEVIQHPRFNPSTNDFDVAVLVLYTPLKFSDRVRNVELIAVGHTPAPGTQSVLTGWGATISGGQYSSALREATLYKVSQVECEAAYPQALTPRMSCSTAGGKGPCQGDEGGPLVTDGVQSGVVSWGYDCAGPRHPAVFAKISNPEIHAFIQNNI